MGRKTELAEVITKLKVPQFSWECCSSLYCRLVKLSSFWTSIVMPTLACIYALTVINPSQCGVRPIVLADLIRLELIKKWLSRLDSCYRSTFMYTQEIEKRPPLTYTITCKI